MGRLRKVAFTTRKYSRARRQLPAECAVCPGNRVVMDILRHGSDVEVLSPTSLRQTVRQRLAATLKRTKQFHFEHDALQL
ncbi:MAG: hypothetical protein Ct9H300mP14_12880 [Gammaproteobacteria bacterium]|nr:MAG: hypothetical protein Ct9H300mP14_12880 [Gammaproteobacteria bacterium]